MANTTLERQIAEMVSLQSKMNSIVNPNWATARYPFLRAAMVEAVEAIEHYSWKWWKKQNPDMKQVQMEIVDIVHFIISDYIVEKTKEALWDANQDDITAEVVEEIFSDVYGAVPSYEPVIEQLQHIVRLSASNVNAFPEVMGLLPMIDMDWNKLYSMYIGKNALNTFRQAYGYKTGEYIKVWNGKEDNEHLYEIIEQVDLTSGSLFDIIYQSLDQRYKSL